MYTPPLSRYFVIYCDNAALAEYPSLARMRDTEVYPIRSNITILAYYHVLTINWCTDVTAVTRVHALLPCYTWAVRSLRGSISALVSTGSTPHQLVRAGVAA